MVGAVFHQEMLRGSRRGMQHVCRWAYALWLLVLLFFTWVADPSLLGVSFLTLLIAQHFLLILLATPAFIAGAITDDKARGTLEYLLTADLSAGEIVLGKLLGRLAEVGLLLLTGLPVLCAFGVFGGLNPALLVGLGCLSGLSLFALGSAGLLASVWCRNTRDAVLSLYALLALDVLVVGTAQALSAGTPVLGPLLRGHDALLRHLNPFFVLAPTFAASDWGELGSRLLRAALVQGGIGSLCLTLAIGRLRSAYVRQLEHAGRQPPARWWRARRPRVSGDPIVWKERQLEGLAPLALLRDVPTGVGVAAVFMLTVISSTAILWNHLPRGVTLRQMYGKLAEHDLPGLAALLNRIDAAGDAFRLQAIAVLLLASLVVAIRCSGAVSGEREQRTWEALLLTPLDVRQLLRGKLRGILGASYPYLRAYAIPAVALAVLGGPMALFWTVVWLAVTWLALYYVGAAGIWCSVRSRNSWRSLLGTLGFCYVGGFVVFFPLQILVALVAGILTLTLMILDKLFQSSKIRTAFGQFLDSWSDVYFAAMCLVLAGVFWMVARRLLQRAEGHVSNRERIRHWDNESAARRERRQASRKLPSR